MNALKRLLTGILTATMVIGSCDVMAFAQPNKENIDDSHVFLNSSYGYHSVDLSSVREKSEARVQNKSSIAKLKAAALPSEYGHDLIADMPYLQGQGSYDTCWSFATMTVASYNMWKKTGDNAHNYSESKLAYFLYNQTVDPMGGTVGDSNTTREENGNFSSNGGNFVYTDTFMATGFAISEESVYEDYQYDNMENLIEHGLDESKMYEDEALRFYQDRLYFIQQDSEQAKRDIMEYGAIGASIHAPDTIQEFNKFYSEDGNCYYSYSDEKLNLNHAIAIVGWDDNFSKENFLKTPEHDGAWLIRNSWKDSDADTPAGDLESIYGYFWVSYDDAVLNSNIACCFEYITPEDEKHHDNIYQYDGAAATNAIPGEQSVLDETQTTAIAANIFTCQKEHEQLKAVNFYTQDFNYSYDIDIYKNLSDDMDPESGELVYSGTGTEKYPGYVAYELEYSVDLLLGDTFSIVVTQNGKDVSSYIESVTEDYDWFGSNYATMDNWSFLKREDQWMSVSTMGIGNTRIKAQTDTVSDTKSYASEISIDVEDEINILSDEIYELSYTTPEAVAPDALVWTSSDNSVARAYVNGRIIGISEGSATISVSSNGVLLKSFDVNVTKKVYVKSLDYGQPGEELYVERGETLIPKIISSANEKLIIYNDNEAVISVDSLGRISGLQYGTANIVIIGKYIRFLAVVNVTTPECWIDSFTLTNNYNDTATFRWDAIDDIQFEIIPYVEGQGLLYEEASIVTGELGEKTINYSSNYSRYHINVYVLYEGGASNKIDYLDIYTLLNSPTLTVSHSGNKNILSYSCGTSAKYIIERSTDGVLWVKIADTAATNYTDIDNISVGKEYFYRVKAYIPETNNEYVYFPYNESKYSNQKALIDLKDCTITVANGTYTGKEVKPKVTVSYKNVAIDPSKYKLTYINNIKAGTGSVKIEATTAKQILQGTVTQSFSIGKAAQTVTASTSSTLAVGKKTKVTASGIGKISYKVTAGTAYATISSSGEITAKAVGTVTILVTASGDANYKAATKTITVKITPAATAKLTFENVSGGIKLTWNKVAGATGYSVYRSSDGGKTYTRLSGITSGSTVTYTDKGSTKIAKPAEGVKYTYKIVSTAATGTGLYKTASTYYVAPTTMVSVTNGNTGIAVKWNKNSKATGYIIYRSVNGNAYEKVFMSTKNTTLSWADRGGKTFDAPLNGSRYVYKVCAYKKVGTVYYKSALSSVKYTIRLATPSITSISNPSTKTIKLAWKKNSKATGYQIQYCRSSTFKGAASVKVAGSTGKSIGKLVKGSTYYVRVRTYKTVNGVTSYSNWSAVKKIKITK